MYTHKTHGRCSGMAKAFPSLLLAAFALLCCGEAMATTYYSGSATGDPTQLTSWWDTTGGTGNHPANFTSGDTFIIQNTHTYTIPAATTWTVNATTAGTAATVQINTGGTLSFSLGTSSNDKLLLGGNFVRNGTLSGTATTSTGTIEFTSNGSWTGSGDISGVKMNVQVDSGVTLDASALTARFKLRSANTTQIIVNGILNLGTLQVDGGSTTGSAQFHLNSGGTLITANTSASGVPGIFTGFAAGKITLDPAANYTFNGAAAQFTGTTANNATMPTTVSNVTVINSSGLTLSQETTFNGTLTLTSGKVTGNAILSTTATLSGGSSTAYISGQLTVPFSAPSSLTYTFPVGTASAYSPITLTSFTDSGSGTLTASATASQNPNPGSGIDGSLYIARYWTLTGSGFSSPTYNFTGTYVPGDIQNGANPNSLIVRKWNGGWTAPTSSSSAPYTVTGTGFSGSFGDFATGQAQTTLPALDSLTKSAIINTAATLGGTLENDFSQAVSEYGVVWSTAPSPTTSDNKVQVGTTLSAPNSFTASVTGLPVATTIYYRAYAINASGTGYSTNGSFLTLTNEPTVQASGVSVAARQNGNLVVSWTRGNGARCIVLVKSTSAVDADPVDGSSYTANQGFAIGSQIGSGNYVAYLGTGTSVTLTNLTGSTTYYVAVYELNGSGGTENYLTTSPATGNQTTVATPITSLTWTGSVDSDWNNSGNWDGAQVPDVGTPLTIAGAGNPPLYSNQMAAATVGPITQSGPLTIATNKFVIDAAGTIPLTLQPSGFLTIVSNGVLTITNSGSVTMTTPTGGTTPIIDVEGGSLIMTNNSGAFFMGDNTSSDTGIGAVITNNGGHIVIDQQLRVRCRDSRFYMSGGTLDLLGGLNHNVDANDGRQFFAIAGGTANLGAVTIDRATTAGGLSVEGGVVNSSSMRIGTGIAAAYSRLTGGVWNNAGAFYIGDRNNAATSGTRNPIFNMSGGSLVTSGSDGIVINNQGESSSTGLSINGGILQVSGGTIIAEGLYLNGPSVTANSAATFQFTGGTMYLGSVGFVANTSGAGMTATLNVNGGTLGAKADWASSAALPLSGPLTLKAADISDVAHNITLNGAVSGSSGALIKTGAGTLTLNAANTYGGATTISNGILALGASGTLANTPQITLSSTATLDASAAGGFTLGSGKVLSGSGTVLGAFSAGSGSTISVGNSVGTLTFSSGLTLGGNTLVGFEISPTNNDLIEIGGNLDASVSGNTISITALGGVLAPGTYSLIHYTGSFVGNINNFTLVGAPGYLTNNTTAQVIQLVTTGVRAPASIVWVGNASSNNWDVLQHTNWLNGAALDSFVQGDTVLFNATGSAHPSVTITDPVTPAAITVDATANYTFSGSGSIGGTGGLTKTNTGTLVILTTNSYTGPTVIGNGTLEVVQLANGGSSSAIGAANNDTNNLVFYGGTLKYSGATASTDRGAILNGAGTISVTNSSTVLTDNGTFVGTGTLTKAGQGTLVLANANTHSGGTAITNGTLQINTATSLGSGPFTNINGTLKINSALTIANTVEFDGNCTLDLSNSGGDTALDGAWAGTGNVTVINQQNSSRTFTVGGNGNGGGSFSAFSGTLNMGTNSGFLRFNDSGGSPNLGSPNMTIDMGTGSSALLARNGGITIDIGALRGGSATRVIGRGTGSAGTITYSIGALGIDSTFAGTITNNASDVAVTKVGTGKFTLSGTNTYTGATSMSGGELEVDGAIASSSITVGSGILSGKGWIGGPTTVYALLAPGSGGIGTLTISNNLTIDLGSTNNFVVTSAGGASNHVAVVGTLNVNSSVIHITSGSPLAGGTYNLFTYGSISGAFDPTVVFDVAPTGTATIVDNGSQINLVIASTTGPTLTGMDISNLQSGTVGISATNGTPNGSFAVLMSTNLTLPLANWTSVVTNQFEANGNYSGTVSVNPSAPQQFLMLQQLP